MEEVNSIVQKFINSLNTKLKDSILAVIVYGSRVKGTNNKDSDLDLLLICDGKINYRIGSIIDGIKVDCTLYAIDSIYVIMDTKKKQNNSYFSSVLKYGYVVEDKTDIVDMLKNYLEEIEMIKESKRRISKESIAELSNMYDDYLNCDSDYNYYNLLEKIRLAFHFKGRYSYLSLVKVPKVYRNKDYYKEYYQLSLPSQNYINIFLEAIECDKDRRKDILEQLFKMLGITLDNDYDGYFKDDIYLTEDEIKNRLVVMYNRINCLHEMVLNNAIDFDYIFNVTLRQLIELCNILNIDIDKNINTNDRINKVRILWRLFTVIKDLYHFDCDEYVLKLK